MLKGISLSKQIQLIATTGITLPKRRAATRRLSLDDDYLDLELAETSSRPRSKKVKRERQSTGGIEYPAKRRKPPVDEDSITEEEKEVDITSISDDESNKPDNSSKPPLAPQNDEAQSSSGTFNPMLIDSIINTVEKDDLVIATTMYTPIQDQVEDTLTEWPEEEDHPAFRAFIAELRQDLINERFRTYDNQSNSSDIADSWLNVQPFLAPDYHQLTSLAN